MSHLFLSRLINFIFCDFQGINNEEIVQTDIAVFLFTVL